MKTLGEFLGACLRTAGVSHAYGVPVPGIDVHEVDDPEAAVLMAAAHARLEGVAGAALPRPGELWLVSEAGAAPAMSLSVDDAWGVAEAVAVAVSTATAEAGVFRIELDVDPAEALPAAGPRTVVPTWFDDTPGLHVGVLEAVTAAQRPVVLAGPGVVRAGADAVAGLRAVAEAASVGVLNTWGAKGLFHWSSPHHLATAGLQAWDFELAGFADADLIVATGVDPYEAPPELWQLAPYVEVDPHALAALAQVWRRPATPIGTVPLRARLAEAVTEWSQSDAIPIAPGRAVVDAAAALGPDGFVAADPGAAGLWIARTFATTVLGSVAVPARADTRGWAAASACVSRLLRPDRRALGVVTELDDVTAAVLEHCRRAGLDAALEVWDPDAAPVTPEVRAVALDRAISAKGSTDVIRTCVDLGQTEALVDIAGPVVAWQQ